MEIKDRILQILNTEQLSSAKFADILGVQRSSISHILSGRNKPSLDFIEKIFTKFTQLDPDWLILGKGEMYRQKANTLFDSSANTATISPTSDKTLEQTPVSKSDLDTKPGKEIERIVIFYKDKTFTEYQPES